MYVFKTVVVDKWLNETTEVLIVIKTLLLTNQSLTVDLKVQCEECSGI